MLIKYFIGYSNNDVIRHLYLMLLQMTGYAKNFERIKKIYFNESDNTLLKM